MVTRPAALARETAARVEALGLRPVIAPMLEIQSHAADLPRAGALQGLVVTSAAALPELPPSYRFLPVLAVGTATAERARAAGFTRVESSDGDAAALARLCAVRCVRDGAPLLLPCGLGEGGRLVAALEAAGFRVIRREVYAQQRAASLPGAAERALREGSIAAALFFSAATARAFDAASEPPGGPAAWRAALSQVDALAISEGTAAALAPLPWRRIRVARRPNQDELLALLDV